MPSSTTVTSSEATRCPMRPVNAEVLLPVEVALEAVADRLVQQDAGQPGPSTTSMVPAGASTALRFTIAWRAASFAKRSHRPSSRKNSNATRPPPPKVPIWRLSALFGDAGDCSAAKAAACRRS